MGPKVSVIVPVYNVEPYLHRCVDSIVSQTLNDIEIILVNDGSTDRCGEILDEYASKDPRIIVIHKENGGQCTARNAGLDIAKGDYIGFVDSDDWIDENMYAGLYQSAKLTDADIIVCGRQVYSEEGELKTVVNLSDQIIDLSEIGIEEYVFNYFFFPHTPVVYNKLYKRELIHNHNLRFDNIHAVGSEDTLFNFSAICHSRKLSTISQLYYNGTARHGSTARTYKKGEMERTINLLIKYMDYAKRIGKLDTAKRIVPYIFLYFLQRHIKLINNVFGKESAKVIAEEIKFVSRMPIFQYSARKVIFGIHLSGVMKRKGYRFSGRAFQRIFLLLCSLNMYSMASKMVSIKE